VMMDIKHMDSIKHREATGVSNNRILDNARLLAKTDKPILFHTPIIPTFNDTPSEIAEIAKFIHSLMELRVTNKGIQADISWVLLPFHRLATDKYKSLGLEYKAYELTAPSREKMNQLISVAQEYGVNVK
jgi:pyruvate formate lyase activating enzyme